MTLIKRAHRAMSARENKRVFSEFENVENFSVDAAEIVGKAVQANEAMTKSSSEGTKATPRFKLVYFDLRGLFEGARLMLHYAGVEFEDERWQISDFPRIKNEQKYGQLPYMQVDGGPKMYQSVSIIRFLADELGLSGKDKFERALVNEICDFHKECYATLFSYIYAVLGFRHGNKKKLRKEVFVPNAPRIFNKFEELLEESGSGFLVPSGITYVDFMVADWLDLWSTHAEPAILGEHPKLAEYVKRIYALPQLQKYLAERPAF